jgi:hypothetical protein
MIEPATARRAAFWAEGWTTFNETAPARAAFSPWGDHSSMEIAMNKRTAIALAAAALLAGVSAASAAPMAGAKTESAKTHSAAMAPAPHDTLALTSAQRKAAWNDLYTGALNQKTPSGFNAAVGVTVPSNIVTAPVPAKAAAAVPALKPYKFAMVQKKLVIVNPNDGKIADVIAR